MVQFLSGIVPTRFCYNSGWILHNFGMCCRGSSNHCRIILIIKFCSFSFCVFLSSFFFFFFYKSVVILNFWSKYTCTVYYIAVFIYTWNIKWHFSSAKNNCLSWHLFKCLFFLVATIFYKEIRWIFMRTYIYIVNVWPIWANSKPNRIIEKRGSQFIESENYI